MKRRQFTAAVGLLAGLAGCSSSASPPPANSTSQPAVRGENQDAIPEPAGIDEVVWRAPERETVELVIRYHENAPGFVRLVDPSGSEVWRQEEPPGGGEDTIPFGLPVGPEGDWTISTTTDDQTRNLTLVIKRQLRIGSISLNVDDLTISGRNTGTVPTVWVSYIIYTGQHSEAMEVGELLMPGENHEATHEYPFNQYENVRFHLFDGEETYDQQRVDLV